MDQETSRLPVELGREIEMCDRDGSSFDKALWLDGGELQETAAKKTHSPTVTPNGMRMKPIARWTAKTIEWLASIAQKKNDAATDIAASETTQKRNNRRQTRTACFNLPENGKTPLASGSGEFIEPFNFLFIALRKGSRQAIPTCGRWQWLFPGIFP